MSELKQMVDLLLSTFAVYRGYAKAERLSQEFLAKFRSRDEDLRYLVTGSFKDGYPDTLYSDVDIVVILNPQEEMFSQDCQLKLFHPVDEAPAHVTLIIKEAYLDEFKQEHHSIATFLGLVENTEEHGCFVSAEKTRRLNRRDVLPDCIDESYKPSAPWTRSQKAEGGSGLSCASTFRLTPLPGMKQVEVDRVPAIECMGWPRSASEWISRKPRYWPQADTIEKITAGGFMVVPRPSNINGDTMKEWRISFSIAEAFLFDTFDECHAMVYYMLRSLYARSFKQKLHGSLTSYHLKTVMFWMLEETEPTCWSRERIVDIFMCALKKLLKFTRKGFLPHYFIPSQNLFYTSSKEGLEFATRQIKFVLNQPLDALDQMVNSKYVGLIPRLGLLSVDTKTKEDMMILRLPKSVAYGVFTQGEPRDLVRNIGLKSFSQTINDTIISMKSFPGDDSLLSLYLPNVLFGYSLASAMEVSAATFDAEKMDVGQDFLEMDTVNTNQALEMWAELVKLALDDTIAAQGDDKPFLSFMKHFYVFFEESLDRLSSGSLTEGDKETLGAFRTVCATAGAFLATVKFSAKDIANAELYQLLCEVITPIPPLERIISVDVCTQSMTVLWGGSLKMTNCFLKQ
ncbi:PREDICTED: uncharacterized protein LOC107334417 [Acropora digitifera]|uniref:uncharacterized protein LOC107334417 n=1 Tax=Acropora digitifera TaxID=70779 RepID=UPI00077A422F|nr:PREDICTED: uncharacterized protein LOC107334417 [Acropora digitifera]